MSKNIYITALSKPVFKIVAKASSMLNMDSYVIGGYVRDLILNRSNSKDIDIVTVGSGIDLAKKVIRLRCVEETLLEQFKLGRVGGTVHT